MHSQIDDFAAEAGVTSHEAFHVKLITEELFVNFVSYGKNPEGAMRVSIGVLPDRICIRTRDNGVAFNPTTMDSVDTEADLENRPIGGLGIFLMMEIGDNLIYQRLLETNVVTVELFKSEQQP